MSINLKAIVKEKISQGLSLAEALEETKMEVISFICDIRSVNQVRTMMEKVAEEIEVENEK